MEVRWEVNSHMLHCKYKIIEMGFFICHSQLVIGLNLIGQTIIINNKLQNDYLISSYRYWQTGEKLLQWYRVRQRKPSNHSDHYTISPRQSHALFLSAFLFGYFKNIICCSKCILTNTFLYLSINLPSILLWIFILLSTSMPYFFLGLTYKWYHTIKA